MSLKKKSDIIKIVENYLEKLSNKIKILEAYLFGSSARGDRFKESDVDLVIVSNDFNNMQLNERFRIVYSIWPSNIDADLIPLTKNEFNEALKKSIVFKDAKKYWKKIR